MTIRVPGWPAGCRSPARGPTRGFRVPRASRAGSRALRGRPGGRCHRNRSSPGRVSTRRTARRPRPVRRHREEDGVVHDGGVPGRTSVPVRNRSGQVRVDQEAVVVVGAGAVGGRGCVGLRHRDRHNASPRAQGARCRGRGGAPVVVLLGSPGRRGRRRARLCLGGRLLAVLAVLAGAAGQHHGHQEDQGSEHCAESHAPCLACGQGTASPGGRAVTTSVHDRQVHLRVVERHGARGCGCSYRRRRR